MPPPTTGGLIFVDESKMITLAKAKKILGKNKDGLPDQQIELLISQCYALAELMFGHFNFFDDKEIIAKTNGEN